MKKKLNHVSRRTLAMLLCILSLLALIPSTAFAASEVKVESRNTTAYLEYISGSGTWEDLNTPDHYIVGTNDIAYCLQHRKSSPHVGNNFEQVSLSNFYSSRVITGLQIILERGYPSETPSNLTAAEAQYATSNAVRFWLSENGDANQYNFTNRQSNPGSIRAKSGYQKVLDYADQLLAYARSQQILEHRIAFSPASLSMTLSGDYFVGTTTVTLINCNGGYTLDQSSLPSGSQVSGYTGRSGDVLTIKIPSEYGNRSITLRANGLDDRVAANIFMYASTSDSIQNVITIGMGGYHAAGEGSVLLNTPAYLQYKTLVRNGLQHFDAWASTFGETVTAIELAPEGTGYRAKTRFAKFYNLPELMAMFRMVADIQTADMLQLPVPKANFHNVVVKPSQWQQDMVAELAERAEKIRKGEIDPTVDNMLRVTNDGRKLALDQRLINALLPDDPEGKVAFCADDVFRIWEDTRETRMAQLCFCDLSTPKNDGTFNVYADMRDKLTAKGVPEEEIAFIHDANTEAKKKEFFAKVRKGQIRILMGSTQKMGAGTNVQDRLTALHDLDCPWRPSDLAQRLGRIVRQGNKNPEVDIYRYVTEGTFDSYLYQLVENKQRFIAQIMTSKTPVRIAEDVDETALSYAEIKALATGNPLIIEKCQLEMDVNKLKILHASHLSQKYALEDKILKEYPKEIKRLTERIAGYKADKETAAKHPADKDHFPPMKIGGNIFAEKADAGKAIIEACKAMTSPDPVSLGEYRGFQMILSFEPYAKDYRVTLSGALSHTVTLGTDIHGNITRLDNALGGFTDALQKCETNLADTQAQMQAAQSEVLRPFPQEHEYLVKSKRLNEVNSLLNMDEKDSTILDTAPDEGDMEPPLKVAGLER